jgi:hypothetical protein
LQELEKERPGMEVGREGASWERGDRVHHGVVCIDVVYMSNKGSLQVDEHFG